jgi:hypothetical protein
MAGLLRVGQESGGRASRRMCSEGNLLGMLVTGIHWSICVRERALETDHDIL